MFVKCLKVRQKTHNYSIMDKKYIYKPITGTVYRISLSLYPLLIPGGNDFLINLIYIILISHIIADVTELIFLCCLMFHVKRYQKLTLISI